MAWALVVATGFFEVAWSSAPKKADGFRHAGWAVSGIVLAMASLGLLSLALRELPVGTAYAVWVGIGAGAVRFGDAVSPAGC